MPACLQVASVSGTESFILSAGGAESMMLSASTESMDNLSAGNESIILSVLSTESMILSALFGHFIMLIATATKKTIANTDDHRLTTLVNSTSTALPTGLPPKGAKFCHTVSGASMPPYPIVAVF